VTFEGHYLDGRTPVRRAVTVRVVGAGLDLTLEDGATVRWPLDEVRQTQGVYAGDPVRFERGPAPETLLVDDPSVLVAIRDTVPDTGRRFHDPRRRRARLGATIVALAVALVLSGVLYVWGIPAVSGIVARWVPVAWEDRVGALVVDQVVPVAKRCTDPAAQAVLDAVMRRLLAAAGPVPYRFHVVVADVPVVNALAAPGGHLVLFRGLLEQSRSPEELAGVLAHEIQHVLKRHSTRLILQHASTALVVAALLGDVSGLASVTIEGARVFGAMAYSRAHEAEADEAGLHLLLAARIDPAGLIGMFDDRRIEGPPGALRYFASHPPSAERAAALRRRAGTAPQAFTPVLDAAEWSALRGACRGAKGREPSATGN
jgi:Zn-dependent protease with chaperone function